MKILSAINILQSKLKKEKMSGVLAKVIKKLYRLLTNPVYRYFYKPSGVIYLEMSEDNDNKDYRQIINLDQASQYNIYVTFDSKIDTDLDVSIAVINRDKMLVSGASWQWESGRILPPRRNNIFTKRHFYTISKKIDGTVFSMVTGGAGEYNYFHWLFDCLPRLHLLRLAGLYDEIDLFFVPSLQYSFQRETLKYLDIDLERTIESTSYPRIKTKKLIVTDHPVEAGTEPIPGWICNFLRQSFLKKAINSQLNSRQIYINRKDAINNRIILNEDELIQALEKLGFISISATNYSLCEQIGIFATAEAIVAAHGAGLGNLVFCQPGTKVVEIFNYEFQPKMYENLSHKIGLVYKKIVTGGVSHKDPLRSDIIVNVEEVINALSSVDVQTVTNT
ncbi:glycosyltransferase family 61 protein [Fortiea contorta]|uniref:glycosyltransferase family 61 protein n=1 Tax=Fortiea contorta TaxID=1892405 RepID=UPI00034C2A4D|nr:glycosyltransferase family 61 protein [Fortiea contorta]